MVVAIDRTSKSAVAKLVQKANMAAVAVLRAVVAALADCVQRVLTDNGIPVTTRKTEMYAMPQAFAIACAEHGIARRLAWVNRWPPSRRLRAIACQTNGRAYGLHDHGGDR